MWYPSSFRLSWSQSEPDINVHSLSSHLQNAVNMILFLSVDDKLTIAQAHDLSNVATNADVHLQALLSKGNQLSIAHFNTQSMVSTFDEFRARMVEYP